MNHGFPGSIDILLPFSHPLPPPPPFSLSTERGSVGKRTFTVSNPCAKDLSIRWVICPASGTHYGLGSTSWPRADEAAWRSTSTAGDPSPPPPTSPSSAKEAGHEPSAPPLLLAAHAPPPEERSGRAGSRGRGRNGDGGSNPGEEFRPPGDVSEGHEGEAFAIIPSAATLPANGETSFDVIFSPSVLSYTR